MTETGSPAVMEAALRRAGFFEVSADDRSVCLGYGLSRAPRCSIVPPRPEPCALPPAAVDISQVTDCYMAGGRFPLLAAVGSSVPEQVRA